MELRNSVIGKDKVGGLVGYNYNYGDIINSFSLSGVWGHNYIGGLVGYNNHYSKISNSYSKGKVTGEGSNIGGLVGRDYANTRTTNSYWDIDNSEHSMSSGGEGKDTESMYKESTYKDWDFGTIWTIDEGKDYPRLRLEKE